MKKYLQAFADHCPEWLYISILVVLLVVLIPVGFVVFPFYVLWRSDWGADKQGHYLLWWFAIIGFVTVGNLVTRLLERFGWLQDY